MNVARVALATVCTAEVLMPAKITGAAMGNCMRARIWPPESPMPRAASMMSLLTSLSPVEALIRIGGMASAVSATRADANPIPSNGKASARIARLGTARPTLPMLMAIAAPSLVLRIIRATGIAIATATSRATRESTTCSLSFSGKSGRAKTSSILESTLRPPDPRPGPQVAFEPEEQQVGGYSKRRREDRAGNNHSGELPVDAVEDKGTQASTAYVRANGGDAYDRHGSDANACYDDRQRKRQLDPEEDLAVRQAHAAGRVYRLRRHGVEACHGIANKDQERVGHEGDDHGRGPDGHPWYGDEDGEEREARYRVEDARNEGDRRVDLSVAGRDDPDGQRYDEGHGDRDEREEDVPLNGRHYVFPEVLPEPIPVYKLRFLEYVLQEEYSRVAHADCSAPLVSASMASKVSSLFSPSISTTALLCPEPRSSERAALAVMRSLMRGSTSVPTLACSRSISPTRVSESRLRTLSAPTNEATNSESGLERMFSGVSYWARTPPCLRMAILSPIFMASSMSWVTKMMVFIMSCWMRKNSS